MMAAQPPHPNLNKQSVQPIKLKPVMRMAQAQSKASPSSSATHSVVSPGSSSNQVQGTGTSIRISREFDQKKMALFKMSSDTRLTNAKARDITKYNIDIHRQNNLADFKSMKGMDAPKTGLGSSYGVDLKRERFLKMKGRAVSKYQPDKQPWKLKLTAKNEFQNADVAKTNAFRATLENQANTNSCFVILSKSSIEKCVEVHPVEDWYICKPELKYDYLSAEEVEDVLNNRTKTVQGMYDNLNVMKTMKKEKQEQVVTLDDFTGRIKSSKDGDDGASRAATASGLVASDDWDNDDDDDDDEGASKKKSGVKKVVKRQKARLNNAEEAMEDSDDGDGENREVDYDTGSCPSDVEDDVDLRADDDGVNDAISGFKGRTDEEAKKKLGVDDEEMKPVDEGEALPSDISLSSSDEDDTKGGEKVTQKRSSNEDDEDLEDEDDDVASEDDSGDDGATGNSSRKRTGGAAGLDITPATGSKLAPEVEAKRRRLGAKGPYLTVIRFVYDRLIGQPMMEDDLLSKVKRRIDKLGQSEIPWTDSELKEKFETMLADLQVTRSKTNGKLYMPPKQVRPGGAIK